MIQPYFSIIIPCLNEEKALPLLLSDIKKQAFSDYEVIVVDGDSIDRTQEIVRKDPLLQLVISKKRNVSIQRNLGAKNAKGKYVVFFDADTRIETYYLTGLAYKTLTTNPDMFTCWSKLTPKDKKNKIITSVMNMGMELSKFMDSPAVNGGMMGFKRTVFNKLGGFDQNITFAEDTEIYKRGCSNGFSFEVFRDPRYIFSLRRFKAEGTLSMLRTYAMLNSKILLKGFPTNNLDSEYPMVGGSLYKKPKKNYKLIDQIESNIKKIKELARLKKLEQYWERLVND